MTNNTEWVWGGCCYAIDEDYPFGFCRQCWEKYGKPQPMEIKRSMAGEEE